MATGAKGVFPHLRESDLGCDRGPPVRPHIGKKEEGGIFPLNPTGFPNVGGGGGGKTTGAVT